MNENIICKPNPAKTLAVSAAPIRELLNFLIYNQRRELLTERARKQPELSLPKVPSDVKELKGVLKASRVDKNGKLFFGCGESDQQVAVLLHNSGAQFWVNYFRCGIGLVNLSFFSQLASAEGSLTNQTRNVTASHEYQWFTHDLPSNLFGAVSESKSVELGDHFTQSVNPSLISPYSIYFEKEQIREPYKFVSGSLARLKEILTWARFVCEGLKQRQDASGRIYVSSHMTVHCGNVKDNPAFEHSTENFMNVVGALAVRENAPYTVLREGFGRRAGGEYFDWARKSKHRIFLNLEQESRDVPVRLKIAARAHLVNWLREQAAEGERIIKIWNLDNKNYSLSN